ncbi:UNVERIFIED_CONTAM: hypothetical protein PYX00_007072 [Menopon gallinae]|uniref:DNA polymerase epsilon subunit n=1 Tax=Menopon gallinae TaxID=328185 RepID=A0AAW2HHP5_9NEOP
MDIQKLRKWILQAFNLRGYSISSDAATFLVNQLHPIEQSERHEWVTKITEHLQRLSIKTLVVDRDQIELCVQECAKKAGDADKIWNVINIFEVPRFNYCNDKHKYVQDTSDQTRSLFSDASNKIFMYRRRYNLIFQRTKRHNLFRQQKLVNPEKPVFVLRTVEWFLCCTDKIENAVLVGLLVQKNETSYSVEDLTGSLQLDMSNAKFHDGLFPEHSIVLIEGVYQDKIFHVHGIGFPPTEPSSKSRAYFGNVNTFGGPSETDLTQCPNLRKIQNKNPDAMIVFISDVWLDKLEVREKLRVLFSGFKEHPPLAFVLIGNFLFSHKGPQNAENLKAGLKALSEIISREKAILDNSRIVLVPGPSDPGSPHILPRAPLPEVLSESLTSLGPKVVLATNPCRIQYCNREIVVIREDLINKMCRNTLHFPKSDDIQTHFVKTIISQGTLVPLSPNVCPVYWNFSHCLDIYPLPDLIVTADQFNAFTVNYSDCKVVNPGSFMKSGFSFRVYLPQANEIEESVIPDDI